jgi:hypothetical protein
MKLTREQLLDKSTKKKALIKWIVICGLTDALNNKEVSQWANEKADEFEIKLTVGGVEIDFEKMIGRWQKNVNSLITDKAKELITEKFGDIEEYLERFESGLKQKVDKEFPEDDYFDDYE